jgi:glycosyltransferase involved in cell wall biosynthesis
MVNKSKLAIVIPFYKASFFADLLEALSSQTNKDFTVYVGDDCSPNDPKPMLKKYHDKLNIKYRRFDERLGHISLTGQWERCFELIGREEWVWFLPDDDLPSIACVESLYQAIEKNTSDSVKVYRIPLNIIDRNSAIIRKMDAVPFMENNYQFYSRVVRGLDGASLGDNIFHRRSFEEAGGFVDFPKAWGSDHATILKVSAGGKIACLHNATLGFRMSGENISSDVNDASLKMSARIMFANWLKQNENIFPVKPDLEFYKYFYWKGEHYVLHEWPFSFKVWIGLFRLKIICLNSYNPLTLIKLSITKLIATRHSEKRIS